MAAGAAGAAPRRMPDGSRPAVWREAACVLILAAAAAGGAYVGSRGLDEPLSRAELGDAWFEADCPRVVENLAGPGVHARAPAHPLFALLQRPLVQGLVWCTPEPPIVAIRLLRAGTAAACSLALYGLLAAIGCGAAARVLLTLLALVSAAGLFWFTVPETYPPGLLSILLVLNLVAWRGRRAAGEPRRRRRDWPVWDLLGLIGTFAFTATNLLAGVLAVLAGWRRREALRLLLAGVCLCVMLVSVQHEIYPSALLWPVAAEEMRYVLPAAAGGPQRVVPAFFLHALIMPAMEVVARPGGQAASLSVQHAWPGSAGAWGMAGVVLWAALLALGLAGFFQTGLHPRLRLVLGLTLAGQLTLHLLYGPETFLYAAHFGPLLIVLAAFGTLGRWRKIALGLALLLLPCAAVNNAAQFAAARRHVTASPFARAAGGIGNGFRGVPARPVPQGLAWSPLSWGSCVTELEAFLGGAEDGTQLAAGH